MVQLQMAQQAERENALPTSSVGKAFPKENRPLVKA